MAGINDTENIHKAMGSEIVSGISDTIKSVLEEIGKPNTAADLYTQRGDTPPGIYPTPPRSPFEGGSPGLPTGASGNFGIQPPIQNPITNTGVATTQPSTPNSAAPFVSSINARVRDLGGGNEASYGMASPEQMAKYPEKGGKIEPFINLGAKGGVDRFALRPTVSAELYPGKSTPSNATGIGGDAKALVRNELARIDALPPAKDSSGKEFTPKNRGLRRDALIKTLAELEGRELASLESNDLRRQHLDQLKIQNEGVLAEKKAAREGLLEEKKSVDFQKKLLAISPPGTMDETGKAQPHWQVGLLDLMDKKHSIQNMPGYTDVAQNLWDQREHEITQAFLKGGQAYVANDINKPGTETYKLRQLAIKRYRDRMLAAAKPKE